ncbi:MAG: response regulator, partial [Clostridiales bacterium]|nr:response regulator [Clostridiales bacterium]
MEGTLRLARGLWRQYLLVFMTFLLMVIVGSIFAGNIVSNHLSTYGREVITASAETLQSYFEGHQITFEDVVFVVEELYIKDTDIDSIEEEIVRWTNHLNAMDLRYHDYIYIYGVLDGLFVQGSDWDVPDDYDPTTRPWYLNAREKSGQTCFSDPYIDAQTGEWIMSISSVLYDENGNDFGVLAFDIYLKTIENYVNSLQLMDEGFGTLFDSQLRFIIHPDATVFNMQIDELQPERAAAMRANDELNAYRFVSLAGDDSVMYSKKLFNGWYLAISSPYDVYYRDVRVMIYVLSGTGLIATLTLCIFLTALNRAKMRSDEEAQIRTTLLDSANAREAAAKEAHRRARIMMDATPFGCKIWNKDSKIIDCNKAAVELFKMRDEDEFISRFFELSPKVQPDGVPSKEKAEICIKNAFHYGTQTFEWMHQLADGTPIPSEIILVRIDYGDDVAVAGYIRDLREHKKMMAEIDKQNETVKAALAEARAASAAKTEFLSNMSHEIRTPMNAILGMTELLLHEPLNKRQMGYINDIHMSGKGLLAIINDILDMSKIEAGKLELAPVSFDFNAFLDQLSSMFHYIAEKKNIEFRFKTADDLPECLYGDDNRLRQILTNICGNAVKFTEQGYVQLRVTQSDGRLYFEIQDTGKGIKKDDMGKLFNAFAQVDTHKNRNVVGTGLGLVISKSFVEMMGGSISFDSEYGEGTVFTVAIPIIEGSEEDIRREESVKRDNTINAPTANVLVVDDNEFNLKVAGGLLSLSAIKADYAFSGATAINLIEENDYDIVFMDHMMPEMDGIEATAIVRGMGDKYETLPIIALTANAIYGAREMYINNGFNGFISKPIDINELNNVLKKYLPQEKFLQTSIPPAEEISPEHAFINALESVPAINVANGLENSGGFIDIYKDMV